MNRAVDARSAGLNLQTLCLRGCLEDGMSPVQTFLDAPANLSTTATKIYRPANFGGGYIDARCDDAHRVGEVVKCRYYVEVALQTGLARIAKPC